MNKRQNKTSEKTACSFSGTRSDTMLERAKHIRWQMSGFPTLHLAHRLSVHCLPCSYACLSACLSPSFQHLADTISICFSFIIMHELSTMFIEGLTLYLCVREQPSNKVCVCVCVGLQVLMYEAANLLSKLRCTFTVALSLCPDGRMEGQGLC